jgi:hypothetical protein
MEFNTALKYDERLPVKKFLQAKHPTCLTTWRTMSAANDPMCQVCSRRLNQMATCMGARIKIHGQSMFGSHLMDVHSSWRKCVDTTVAALYPADDGWVDPGAPDANKRVHNRGPRDTQGHHRLPGDITTSASALSGPRGATILVWVFFPAASGTPPAFPSPRVHCTLLELVGCSNFGHLYRFFQDPLMFEWLTPACTVWQVNRDKHTYTQEQPSNWRRLTTITVAFHPAPESSRSKTHTSIKRDCLSLSRVDC